MNIDPSQLALFFYERERVRERVCVRERGRERLVSPMRCCIFPMRVVRVLSRYHSAATGDFGKRSN